MRRLIPFLLLPVAVAATGCPSRDVSEVFPQQNKEEKKDIPVSINRNVDILFVIDNSGSMEGEQNSIAANFSRFTSVLENIEGGLPNIHLGVVSSNAGAGGQPADGCGGNGDNGRLQNAARNPGCSPPSGYFISYEKDEDGNERKNYSDSLAETFSCIGRLGTQGCGFEQHLEAMRRALDPSVNPENAGFLRSDAYLAVIILADEDDCSANHSEIFNPDEMSIDDPLGPATSFRCFEYGIECNGNRPGREVAELDAPGGEQECEPAGAMSASDDDYLWHPQVYVDFLKSLKPDPNSIMVAGIIGNPDPVTTSLNDDGNPVLDRSCGGNGEVGAAPGIRLKYFLDSFPGRNTFTSICNDDLSDALTQVANQLARVIGNPCIEGNISTEDISDAPGLQVQCSVSDVINPNTDTQEETVMPRCETDENNNNVGSTFPCWHVATDLDHCSAFPSRLSLVIERNGAEPPLGTHVIAGCLVN